MSSSSGVVPCCSLMTSSAASASLNQTVAALRFFYNVTLGHPESSEPIAYARKPHRLLLVLSTDEVVCFLEAMPGRCNELRRPPHTPPGCGCSRWSRSRSPTSTGGRMLIQVEQGKGGKDRYVRLFPSRAERPIEPCVLHAACRSASCAADFNKRVAVHTLHHSFAIHLLEGISSARCASEARRRTTLPPPSARNQRLHERLFRTPKERRSMAASSRPSTMRVPASAPLSPATMPTGWSRRPTITVQLICAPPGKGNLRLPAYPTSCSESQKRYRRCLKPGRQIAGRRRYSIRPSGGATSLPGVGRWSQA